MADKYDKYRAPWHDYTSKSYYHITLMKHPDAGAFGQLAGDWRIEDGRWGGPYVRASAIGRAIKQALRALKEIHPALLNVRYALMPDHLHILLGVGEKLDEHVGKKIAEFKQRVNRLAGATVFEHNYHDHIIMDNSMLETVKKYIADNARRALIRRASPDFFSRTHALQIDGQTYLAYGNIHLLAYPFKSPVIVRSHFTEEKKKDDKAYWTYLSANGGVLVSPFYNEKEKDALTEGEKLAARIIKIINAPLGPREKPAGHDFDLCAQGRLLLISPSHPITVCRANCLFLNSIAKKIANGDFTLRPPAKRESR